MVVLWFARFIWDGVGVTGGGMKENNWVLMKKRKLLCDQKKKRVPQFFVRESI